MMLFILRRNCGPSPDGLADQQRTPQPSTLMYCLPPRFPLRRYADSSDYESETFIAIRPCTTLD